MPKEVVDVSLTEIEFLSGDEPAFFIHDATDTEIHSQS
jgi:hypothetical protein